MADCSLEEKEPADVSFFVSSNITPLCCGLSALFLPGNSLPIIIRILLQQIPDIPIIFIRVYLPFSFAKIVIFDRLSASQSS